MKKTYSLLSLAPPNDESVVVIAGGGENIRYVVSINTARIWEYCHVTLELMHVVTR